MARPKKVKEEIEDIEDSDEEIEEDEEVTEQAPKEIATPEEPAVARQYSPTEVKEILVADLKRLENEIALIDMEERQKTFVETAPMKIAQLEKAVQENRKALIVLTGQVKLLYSTEK